MAEKTPPEKIIQFLNTYFELMIEIIFENNGSLDKLMGDGIMAIFGSPIVTDQEHTPQTDACNAVKTAIAMQNKVISFNEELVKNQQQPIQIGIGIHTGEVILGNVGTEKRMEFTAIGDTVNTAARLESYTKQANVPIVISQATQNFLDNQFKLAKIGSVQLKGKEQLIDAFQVLI